MKPLVFLLTSLLGIVAVGALRAAEPPAKHLLLDNRVVESTEGVALRVGRVSKHPANPLFREDRPWEVRFDNLYANVVFDEKERLYRCWYSPFIVDPAVTETPVAERETKRYRPHDREMGVCYAESRDGLRWEKPALGLTEFAGNTRNNLVVRGPHGAGVMFDPLDADAARRFKMFCRAGDKVRTMAVAFSPDGLHWSEQKPCPEINVPGDTHNNPFWSPEAGKYVGITRLKTDQRLVARTESADFIHWTKAVEVLRGDKLHQTYAMPVFRHGGVYLGLPMIFDTATDRVSCELAWSPDTITWHRIEPGRALIPNSEKRGDYDWGCVYAAATPVFTEKEIRLYYGASNGPHTNWRDGFLALATLRPDGFAGYETTAPKQPGLVTTAPVTCTGRQLRVSADAARGKLRVAVLGDERLGAGQCRPITADVTDGAVQWADGADLSRWVGQPIRLRFELSDAQLYAFSFAN
jgi:hypothetical protein